MLQSRVGERVVEDHRQPDEEQQRVRQCGGPDERERQKKALDDKEDAEDAPSWLGIAFASHPSDADRIAYFRAAAQP